VRQFLLDTLEQFNQLALSRGRKGFLEVAHDTVNLTLASGNLYYESNNVIVRIKGTVVAPTDGNDENDGTDNANASLLISSHYDSTPVSHGVTDDGIAVAVMLELVRTLIYNPPLKHDIILNFNNGEEMYLLGGAAFVYHPWFASVKAFINLEGTGSAPGTRSMLFRTNSMPMMKEWKKSAPFPHASKLFNDIMSLVKSETDYRVYTVYGGLEGVDIAFYTYRYLYHTPSDDLTSSWPISAQHMGDNLLA
jgi:hypothetical protein